MLAEGHHSLQHSPSLSNKNVFLGSVLSAPSNNFYSDTVSCRGICSDLSFKHLKHKLDITLFCNILFIGFHYDSIC